MTDPTHITVRSITYRLAKDPAKPEDYENFTFYFAHYKDVKSALFPTPQEAAEDLVKRLEDKEAVETFKTDNSINKPE